MLKKRTVLYIVHKQKTKEKETSCNDQHIHIYLYIYTYIYMAIKDIKKAKLSQSKANNIVLDSKYIVVN